MAPAVWTNGAGGGEPGLAVGDVGTVKADVVVPPGVAAMRASAADLVTGPSCCHLNSPKPDAQDAFLQVVSDAGRFLGADGALTSLGDRPP